MTWQARSSRLIGRGDELEYLRQLVDDLQAGAGGMVLVVGEAGVGKSRLVREVSQLAANAGVVVLAGRAVPGGEPYRPLVQALTGALRDRPMPRDEALRPYLPQLAGLLPDASLEGPAQLRGGVVLAEAVLRLVSALGRGRGTLLVAEDLHWVDPDTLDVVGYLAHAAEAADLLLLATTRDDVDAPPLLLDLPAQCRGRLLPLRRLAVPDVRGIVESCLGAPPAEELVEFTAEQADGLPFLVEEMLTGLAAAGTLSPDGRLIGPLVTNVPWTFAATVRRRLSALDGAARRVVEAAAVLGRSFDWRLLADVTGLAEEAVLAGLRAAAVNGLVVATAADTFRFRHALTCDAVRDELLPPDHRAIARAAAAAVEHRHPEACDLAARLWAAGGSEIRAAALYLRAGQQARRRGALHTADVLLTEAAALAGGSPELRREANVALLEALANVGDTDRALALGERLLAEGETSVRLVLADVAANAGCWDVAATQLSLVAGYDDPRAAVLAARLAHARGEPDEARRLAESALAAARARGHWRTACQALTVVGRAARLRDTDAARAAFAAAEALATEHDLPVVRVSALHELGTVDLLVDGSVQRLEQARSVAFEAGIFGVAATLDVQIAAGLLHADAAAALFHAQRCTEAAGRLRMDQLQATALFFQAAAYAHDRNPDAMGRCVAEAQRLAPDDPDVNAGIWGAVYAHVALLDDDRPQLAACLDRAVDLLRGNPSSAPAPTHGLWALARTLAGADGATARAEASGSTVNWENRALLGYADAVDAGRAGDAGRAAELLAEADSAMGRRPWWRHRVRLLVADDALADGWGDPVVWAREGLAVFGPRGDDRLASRCRDVLRRAGAPVPRRGRGDSPVPDPLRAFGVTSREMDVLRLVEQGLTNAAIAQRLVLSPRTVETHVANLVAKTNAGGRSGLTALARNARSGQ